MADENPLKTLEDVKRAIEALPGITASAAAAFAELAYCIGRREAFVVSQEIVDKAHARASGHADALKDIEAQRQLKKMPMRTDRPQ